MFPPIPPPDVSHLVTEDDTPVDNPYSEKQMRLLTRPLFASWNPGCPFVAMANVGLYFSLNSPVLVPDTLVSLGVKGPEKDFLRKEHRAYFHWLYGKAPDIVVEIVSNRKGNEDGRKMVDYAKGGVAYYAIFDPEAWLSKDPLRVYELRGRRYARRRDFRLPHTGLTLTLWQGEYEGNTRTWLRWCDAQGLPIPTGAERADAAEARRLMADERRMMAEEKAARLAAKLRELGLDPEQV